MNELYKDLKGKLNQLSTKKFKRVGNSIIYESDSIKIAIDQNIARYESDYEIFNLPFKSLSHMKEFLSSVNSSYSKLASSIN